MSIAIAVKPPKKLPGSAKDFAVDVLIIAC
jgi:hypothetical protein